MLPMAIGLEEGGQQPRQVLPQGRPSKRVA